MPDKLVTVATFSFGEEAHLSKAKLESEGIWSFVADDRFVSANWLYSNVIGGARLQVRESEFSEATRILGVQAEVPPVAAGESEGCPECNSTDVHYERFSCPLVFASWLLQFLLFQWGIPLPFLKRKWKCNACGHEWKARR